MSLIDVIALLESAEEQIQNPNVSTIAKVAALRIAARTAAHHLRTRK